MVYVVDQQVTGPFTPLHDFAVGGPIHNKPAGQEFRSQPAGLEGRGGIALLPGGPRPVDPWGPLLPQTREALRRMALAELASVLVADSVLRRRVEEVGLEAARKALDQWKSPGRDAVLRRARGNP